MPSERIQRQIDRLLDEAEAAILTSDWALVRARAEQALRLDPESVDARGYLEAATRGPNEAVGEDALSSSAPSVGEGPVPSRPEPELGTPAEGAGRMPALPESPSTTDDPAHPEPVEGPTTFLDRYKVERFLGEGGKKQVYLAHDTVLDRDVAFALIKTEGLDQTGRDRIRREGQAMGRLGSHPHIVTVFDLGSLPPLPGLGEGRGEGPREGQPYMVTELMKGGDVEGLLEKAPEHRLALEQAVKLADEVCQGLEFAHSHGIVHRDLKPGNVWLTEAVTEAVGR